MRNGNYLRMKLDESKPLIDYDVSELTAYLLQNYPGDPNKALLSLYENGEVASSIYFQETILLEGLGYDKRR